MNSALLTLVLIVGQPLPPIPQELPPIPRESYEEARDRARENQLPIAIFVGKSRRDVVGMVSISTSIGFFEGYPSACIIIGDDKGNWKATLLTNATDKQIIDAVKGVSQSANPFDQSNKRSSAEDDPWLPVGEQEDIRKLWPKTLEFPTGLRFYNRTRWGQYIAVTNEQLNIQPWPADKHAPFGRSRDNPLGLPALNPNINDPHWRTPGGLHNITGWKSYVGLSLPKDGLIDFWEGRTPVFNAPNGYLHKKLWRFPRGTLFVDLLTYNDKPFEVRYREKEKEWESFVAYKDPEARPEGYTSAKAITGKRCATCHEEADSGEGSQYHLVLRGNDGVRSFPVMTEGTLNPNRKLPIRTP